MPTLLQAIKGEMSSVPQPGATDETARLQDLMRAKSGRSIGVGSTPRMSNLQEQSSVAQSQATAGAQAADAKLALAGAEASDAAAATKTEGQLAGISAGRAAQKQAFRDRESSLTQELKQGKDGVNLERDKAKLEQLGFVSRLNSETYVQELQQLGSEKRLQDEIGFRDAMAQDIFSAELDLLQQSLNYNEMLSADAIEFNELISGMDLDQALAIASANAEAKNQQTAYTAVGSVVSAGASAYGDYKPKTKDTAPKDTKATS